MKICKISGCKNVARTLELCNTHYQRLRRLGSAEAELKIASRSEVSCSVAGCERKSKKRGYCVLHYNRVRRNGSPISDKPDRLANFSQAKCIVDGCVKNAIALNYCVAHRAKFKKFGDPLGGYVQDGRSKEWHIRDNGYVIKFDRSNPYANKVSGIVLQHRHVMGEKIGRPLKSSENVHHINGDKADNRLENLELWVKSQPSGQRVQDLVKWAREILNEYEDIAEIA